MSEKNPTPEQSYAWAEEQIAKAKAPGANSLVLGANVYDGKTAALSVIPPEIADLTELTSLDLRRTQVSDLSALQGLSGLQGLSLSNTQVSDLLPLAGLSKLGEMPDDPFVGAGLWFTETLAADRDDAHRALAAIEEDQDRAKQVLQYLNGEHTEFGGPPEPWVPPPPPPPPEIDWKKQDPYGLSFAMSASLLTLNFGASHPAPLAQQILP